MEEENKDSNVLADEMNDTSDEVIDRPGKLTGMEEEAENKAVTDTENKDTENKAATDTEKKDTENKAATDSEKKDTEKGKTSPTLVPKLKMDIDHFKRREREESKRYIDLIQMGLDTKDKTQTYIGQFLMHEMVLLYDSLDINGNEYLQAEEIKWAFNLFGFDDVTLEECLAVCEDFTGQKGLDVIMLVDFQREMYDAMKHGTTDAQLKMVFDLLDYNKQGIVGPSGIIRLFHKFGLSLEPKEVYDYIDEIDLKKYGVFDFAQFKIYCYEIDLFGKLKNQFSAMIIKEARSDDDEEPIPKS